MLPILFAPKDRLQIATALELDWKTVNHHIRVLSRHGFVREEVVYGRVKMYQLTPSGQDLLRLLQEIERVNRPTRINDPANDEDLKIFAIEK